MKAAQFLVFVVQPALARLPSTMNTHGAQVQLLATGLQESRLELRAQMGGGPARSFYQFEKSAIIECLTNSRTRELASQACAAFGIAPSVASVMEFICRDDGKGDVLATVFARLNYYASPLAMPINNATESPSINKADIAWHFYRLTWRPGKPRVDTWDMCYWRAYALVEDMR